MTTPIDKAAYRAAVDAALPRWRRVLGAPASVLGGVVAVVVVAAVVALVVVPRALGGTTLTVLTGSMVPAFNPGDVVAVAALDPGTVCERVRIGEVISYLPNPDDPTLITHRVIAKGTAPANWKEQGYGAPCTFITQGDANNAPDDTVLPKQVRGVVLYAVPWLGHVRQWFGTNPDSVMWAALGIVLVVGLVTWLVPRRRLVTVTIPVDPRVEAAALVVAAWRADPRDEPALENSLAALAGLFDEDGSETEPATGENRETASLTDRSGTSGQTRAPEGAEPDAS